MFLFDMLFIVFFILQLRVLDYQLVICTVGYDYATTRVFR